MSTTRGMTDKQITAKLHQNESQLCHKIIRVGLLYGDPPPFGHLLLGAIEIAQDLYDMDPWEIALPMSAKAAAAFHAKHQDWRLPRRGYTLKSSALQGQVLNDVKIAWFVAHDSLLKADNLMQHMKNQNAAENKWSNLTIHWKKLTDLLHSYWMYHPTQSKQQVYQFVESICKNGRDITNKHDVDKVLEQWRDEFLQAHPELARVAAQAEQDKENNNNSVNQGTKMAFTTNAEPPIEATATNTHANNKRTAPEDITERKSKQAKIGAAPEGVHDSAPGQVPSDQQCAASGNAGTHIVATTCNPSAAAVRPDGVSSHGIDMTTRTSDHSAMIPPPPVRMVEYVTRSMPVPVPVLVPSAAAEHVDATSTRTNTFKEVVKKFHSHTASNAELESLNFFALNVKHFLEWTRQAIGNVRELPLPMGSMTLEEWVNNAAAAATFYDSTSMSGVTPEQLLENYRDGLVVPKEEFMKSLCDCQKVVAYKQIGDLCAETIQSKIDDILEHCFGGKSQVMLRNFMANLNSSMHAGKTKNNNSNGNNHSTILG